MHKRLFLLIITILTCCSAVFADAVGTWKIYHSYSSIDEIVPTGSRVYVKAYGNLYSYNISDNTVTTYTKEDGMGSQDVKFMAWNSYTKKLVIVYDDYTIDLLSSNDDVETIVSVKEKRTTIDKTIHSIYIYNQYAYLCTAFGMIKIDTKDASIADTYQLGLDLQEMVIENNVIYAISPDALYEAKLTDNLLDKENWKLSGKDWDNLAIKDNVDYNSYGMIVYDEKNKCYWGSNAEGQLTKYTKNENEEYTAVSSGVIPDGPKYPEHAVVKIFNNKLHTLRGLYNLDADSNSEGFVQTFDGTTWGVFDNGSNDDTYVDYITMDIDPTNSHRIMVGSKNGLFEYIDGKLTNHYTDAPLTGGDFAVIVSMAFDKNGNLWLFNRYNTALLCLTKAGEWETYNSEALLETDGVINRYVSTFFDSRGLMWFCNNHYNGNFFGFYDIWTNTTKLITEFTNQDGKNINPPMTYNSRVVTEDKEGNIWLGTNNYTVYITASDIKKMLSTTDMSSIYVTQHKVARNDDTGLADYLLNDIPVRDIKVDNANRKWIATDNNGIYVISSDNNTELEHFTTENSPLPTNDIRSICIDDNTGKVYIGTLKGLCTYESGVTSNYGTLTESNIYAYPNPVPPDYTGMITIKGLIENAQIKITTTSGYVVHEGISNGATYQWDGCDQSGERVASGIYMVLTTDKTGEEGCVTKIAMVK